MVPGDEPTRLECCADGPGLVVDLAPGQPDGLAVGRHRGTDETDTGAGVRRRLQPSDGRGRKRHRSATLSARPDRTAHLGRPLRRLSARHDHVATDHERNAGHRRDAGAPVHRDAGPRDRAQVAGPLGRRGHVRVTQPGGTLGRPGRRRQPRPEAVHPRHVPVPVGHRAARRSPARLHRHRCVRSVPADGRPQRPLHDGLRRVRAPGRAVRRADGHPSGDHDG